MRLAPYFGRMELPFEFSSAGDGAYLSELLLPSTLWSSTAAQSSAAFGDRLSAKTSEIECSITSEI